MMKQLLFSALIAISASTWCMERPQLTNKEKRFLLTQCAQKLLGHYEVVHSVAFHPNGKQLASGARDRTVKLWDLEDRNRYGNTVYHHTKLGSSVAYNPQGTQLASATSWYPTMEDIIMIHDPQTSELLHTIHDTGRCIDAITYNFDGSQLINTNDFTIKIWDPQQGKLIKTLKGHKYWVECVVSNPHDHQIATGSHDKTAKLWDPRIATCSTTFEGHGAVIKALTYNPQGTQLITTTIDGDVKIWDVRSNKPLKSMLFSHNHITAVAWNPCNDEEIALGLGLDGATRLQNLHDENSYTILKTTKGTCNYEVHSVAYSPDGKQLAAGLGTYNFGGSPSNIDLWNLELVKKINDDYLRATSDIHKRE